MSDDIVKRLCALSNSLHDDFQIWVEAADEIERLHAENERLREALVGLLDVQNGAPLIRYQSEYDAAVALARAAIKEGE